MVNGPDQVFIERRGVLTKADVRFEDENQLLETIRRMVATTGRHIDGLNPMVDARLPDGSRVNAIIRPAAIHGAALTIRKFKDAVLGMEDLTREGSLSPAMAEFLERARRDMDGGQPFFSPRDAADLRRLSRLLDQGLPGETGGPPRYGDPAIPGCPRLAFSRSKMAFAKRRTRMFCAVSFPRK